jgi:hypothetical protein
MFEELVKDLTSRGETSLEVTDSRPVRVCRTQLIEAARRANVRIAMTRNAGAAGTFIEARVLDETEAELQRIRDTIFRGVNRIRTGLEILTSGTIDTEPITDQVEDLKEIVNELEEYAKDLMVSGATV